MSRELLHHCLTVAALAAPGFACGSQSSRPAPEAGPVHATAAEEAAGVSLLRERIAIYVEVNAILAGLHSKAAAESARPKLEALVPAITTLNERTLASQFDVAPESALRDSLILELKREHNQLIRHTGRISQHEAWVAALAGSVRRIESLFRVETDL